MTREQWLEKAKSRLAPLFKQRCGKTLPRNIKITMSFPLGTRKTRKKKVVGQCLHKELSSGKRIEILINPEVDTPWEIIATLTHELIHAICGTKINHKPPFQKIARHFGFLPPWTSTPSPPILRKTFKRLAAEIGPFPHKKIVIPETEKKQTTRMIKLQCLRCGFICRASRQALEQCGIPFCACGEMMDLSV